MCNENALRKTKITDGKKDFFEPAEIDVIVFVGEDIITESGDDDCIELIETLN